MRLACLVCLACLVLVVSRGLFPETLTPTFGRLEGGGGGAVGVFGVFGVFGVLWSLVDFARPTC